MINNMQGISLALMATALFAIAAAMSKVAAAEYHVLQILFIRQIIVFLSVLPTVVKTFPNNLKTNHLGLHSLRLIGAFAALATGIWAVSVLPLTTATVLAFSQVFFVTLLALWFLKEPVGLARISAVLLGFIGVIIVMRPSVDGVLHAHSLIAITGAFGAAIAVTCVRKLSQSDSTTTLLTYQAIFVGLIAGIPMLWLWVTPTWSDLLLMVGIGLIATIAQWLGIMALRAGEASVIGSIEYLKLIYAALLGYLLFSEIPDFYTIIGATIIITSALYTVHREARHKNRIVQTSKTMQQPIRMSVTIRPADSPVI